MIKRMINKLFGNTDMNQEPNTDFDRNDLQEPNCPEINEKNVM